MQAGTPQMPDTPKTPKTPDDLNAVFSALADPTRRAILARLANGEQTATELAGAGLEGSHDMTMPAFTKHIKVLERAGLITRSRKAQARPCRLEPERLKTATDWLDQYRLLWEGRFDRLEAYLGMVTTPDPDTDIQ